MNQDQERKPKDLITESPIPCDLKVGDLVIFTNDYGVQFKLTVVGFCVPSECLPERFIYLNDDSWWFPHKRDQLALVKPA